MKGRHWLLLACGLVGPILFYAVFTLAGATRPGYSAIHDVVGALSRGEEGWIQIANFIVFGLLLIGFAAGLRSALQVGRGSAAGPLLLAVAGAGLVIQGLFVPDPIAPGSQVRSASGALHGLGSAVFNAGIFAAALVLAWRFGIRRGFGLYSAATGLMVLVVFQCTNLKI